MMYSPDLSQWSFNKIMGLGDKEHNRRVREKRENARPIMSDTSKDVVLWNIWVYYQKDLARQLSEKKKSAMGMGGMEDDE